MHAARAARVLIVEDDPIVAEIYRLALSRAGFEVLVAGDGQTALEVAADARPDFVFLDIRLPKVEGMEVLRRLREGDLTRQIPVVMLSNFDDAALIRSSLALGAKQYLVKVNTDPTELPAIVSQWVDV